MPTISTETVLLHPPAKIYQYFNDSPPIEVQVLQLWSKNSAGIHTLSNVGIGTTNPTSKLHVIGDGRFSGVVTATTFIGDGSGLTGVVGSGSGVIIRDDGALVGTAGIINFATNLAVSPIVAGVVTVTGSVAGIDILGTSTFTNLSVSGVSTFIGFSTFQDYVFVQDGLNVSGVSTLGITTATQLSVSGVSILGVTTATQLSVSGVSTLGITTTTSLSATQLSVSGVSTLGITTATQLSVSGVSTLGITTTTSLSATQLSVSGVVTATTFIGDGSGLTGVVGSGSGVIIRDDGALVGTAGTIDFGDNLTVSAISAGIVTVTASSQFVTTATGIHTLSSVGIGTTNPNAVASSSNATVLSAGIVTAYKYYGDGSSLSGIDATRIINGTSNVTVASGSTISATVAGENIFNVTGAGVTMVAGKRFDVSSYSENVNFLGFVSGLTYLDIGTYSVFVADISGTTSVTFQYQSGSLINNRLFSGTLILRFSGTGSRNVSLTPLNPKYIAGSGPTYSTTAVTDIISFFTPDNGATTYVTVVGQGFA